MSKQLVDISVVIVNYKGWSPLHACLEQLINIDAKAFSFETIVVDNCSNDGFLENFETEFETVDFYKNTANNGFANGCNFGASKAKGTYLLFLNPDTLANAEALGAMLNTAKAHPDYGIVSCQQVNQKGNPYNHNKLFLTPSRMFGFLRAFYKLTHHDDFNQRFDESKSIIFPDWVTGAVILMSRDWFNKVKGWNEDYWMYFEDVDLCKKVSETGGKVAVIKTANIIHAHGGSTRINVKTKALTKSEVIISTHVYIQNHFKGVTRIYMQFLMLLYQLISNLIMGTIGLLLFLKPKLSVHFYLAVNMFSYYLALPFRQQWLSKRSINFKL